MFMLCSVKIKKSHQLMYNQVMINLQKKKNNSLKNTRVILHI